MFFTGKCEDFFKENLTVFTGSLDDLDFPSCFNWISKYWKMKNRVPYKKEPKIEICYQGVITTRLVTCNLPSVQSLKSLIMQIQWECSFQVRVLSRSDSQIVIRVVAILNYNTRICEQLHGDSCSVIHFWESQFRYWVSEYHRNCDSSL